MAPGFLLCNAIYGRNGANLSRDGTIPVSHRDLLDQQTGVLATIDRVSGLPQLTATAFFSDPEDGALKISINDSRHKMETSGRIPRRRCSSWTR
ncbi:MAG TPA: hypothetical protein VGP60_27325 [Amycolatopsis sp.]|nr:hypothetical protein [Amycolatopsis sp.]